MGQGERIQGETDPTLGDSGDSARALPLDSRILQIEGLVSASGV